MPDVSKTREEKAIDAGRLERLIEAGEQASATFRVLPVDIQQAYVKQFAMLLAETEKLKLQLPKEKA
jgi:phosphoenolpyruvate synthase/pyruvate phosphate dikinase